VLLYITIILQTAMMNSRTRTSSTLGIIVTLYLVTTIVTTSTSQYVDALRNDLDENQRKAAPIASFGENNVYIAWWNNKTGNDEVMFKASTDGGKTFADKMNLSNSTNADSQDAQIAASGNNVYVSWWERANQTSNEPVLRVSNDNGKTFGEKIMLSAK
jgi:hypothetical protein